MNLEKFQKFNRLTDIPLELLSDNNIKCVMIDMDSTLLVWHGEKVLQPEIDWCDNVMRHGIKIIIVSNAIKSRTKAIAEQMGIAFIAPSMKPWPFGLWKAAKTAAAKRRECVMIGDQMLTDKISAQLAGIKFILLNPLSNVEFGMTKVNRKLEKIIFGRDTSK